MATDNDKPGAPPPPDGRLPYEKPAIAWRRLWRFAPDCWRLSNAGFC